MRKNPHGRILKREPKEYYLSTVPKSCPLFQMVIYKQYIYDYMSWLTYALLLYRLVFCYFLLYMSTTLGMHDILMVQAF